VRDSAAMAWDGCSTTSRTSSTSAPGGRRYAETRMSFTHRAMINLGKPPRQNPVRRLDRGERDR